MPFSALSVHIFQHFVRHDPKILDISDMIENYMKKTEQAELLVTVRYTFVINIAFILKGKCISCLCVIFYIMSNK